MSPTRKRRTESEAPPKLYGYVRVSHHHQVEEGESLDVQQRKIEGYAQMQGEAVAHVFVERAVSGGKPFETRPEGKALMARVRSGDTIVAAKLDRMFRNSEDALRMVRVFQERRIKLVLLDIGGEVTNGGSIAKVFFTLLAAFAEFERSRISERIRDVKSAQRKRGAYLGGVRPFGWKSDGQGALEEVPHEQKAIALILELRDEGRSLRAISKEVKQQTGAVLSYEAVRAVLARKGKA